MKTIKLLSSFALLLFFAACNKVDDLPLYQNGVTSVLTASTLTVAPVPADSNKSVLKLTWTSPVYASDSATYKYIVQIDNSGNNFKSANEYVVTGALSKEFIAKDLNSMLLARGFDYNTTHDMDVRVISSYGNNNERYFSNVLKVKMTTYKTPPKIPVPPALYLVGDPNGWNNSGSLDKKYYFYKTGETTYEGVFNFSGSSNYKLIQVLGEWGSQYHMLSGGTSASGFFEQKDADPAFPTPSTPGSYRIVVDFQNATYTVTKTDAVRSDAPANLYLVGDVNGWNNSNGLDPKYKFTKVNDFVFTNDVDFAAGGGYKLIQDLGVWGSQFHMISGGTAFAGEFVQQDADPTFPNPTPAGKYRITVNFATMTFTAVKL